MNRQLDVGLGGPADVVVLAPHPDDEVFGVAALMCGLVSAGHSVRLVAVTDGEACFGQLSTQATTDLIAQRVGERHAALQHLGIVDDIELIRLRLPDGHVAEHRVELTARVGAMAATVIVSTWRHDGHPDHEAVGESAANVAKTSGARLLEYPIWAFHLGRLDSHELATMSVVPMTPAMRAAKLTAVRLFRSQLDPSPNGTPVVPAALVDRLANSDEVVFG
ncbi:MAG: PIG-L family deacetylase [Actinomycetota bacterium]|nr:PIG-L family deacetylase [Actinomycetota bacterium]MDQ3350422.1 PIG-L family deacetylase [Actinomycetota bacterium]